MEHIPVLLHECINGLNIKPTGIYTDGTLGRAGHALEIVKKLTTGKLIAIDRDEEALSEAKKKLAAYKEKIIFIHGNFKDTSKILNDLKINKTDGMLFDFGVSSPQLDNATRGFSYMQDAPLDMRMDMTESLTAYEIVNTWPEKALKKILFEYGEERYSKSVAREIVKKRNPVPIETTFGLNEIIISAIPAAARREAQHPSKRCFQALRIAVNGELGSISNMLSDAPALLNNKGRIVIISFHSLEDRLVKTVFSEEAKGCVCSKELPVCICKKSPTLKIITKKPVTASIDEIDRNPRARSAKLRIAEKI